jgi:methionyl aminopeptidase
MGRSLVFTEGEIASFRAGGNILAACLAMLRNEAKPGVTTMRLDALCEAFIRDHGGIPAFKGYEGFPSSLCTSINDECVHGMPGPRMLKDGDIINLDSGVIFDGLYTDAGLMAKVGNVPKDAHRVVDATEEALRRAIALVKAGVKVGDISHVIGQTAREFGCSPVQNLVGHGLGRTLHCYPDIPNEGRAGSGPALPAGTVVAIEPIFTLGSGEMRFMPDGWTIVSSEGALCAQTEHSVLVTEHGYEILA